MLALMVSALAGSLGSRNAPDASLNQLATSTETVKFEVPGPTVIGVANSISISASAFDVNVKAWAVPPAGVNMPDTVTPSSFAWTPPQVPAGTSASRVRWVVGSRGRFD